MHNVLLIELIMQINPSTNLSKLLVPMMLLTINQRENHIVKDTIIEKILKKKLLSFLPKRFTLQVSNSLILNNPLPLNGFCSVTNISLVK